jgi:hypothetical protein
VRYCTLKIDSAALIAIPANDETQIVILWEAIIVCWLLVKIQTSGPNLYVSPFLLALLCNHCFAVQDFDPWSYRSCCIPVYKQYVMFNIRTEKRIRKQSRMVTREQEVSNGVNYLVQNALADHLLPSQVLTQHIPTNVLAFRSAEKQCIGESAPP